MDQSRINRGDVLSKVLECLTFTVMHFLAKTIFAKGMGVCIQYIPVCNTH